MNDKEITFAQVVIFGKDPQGYGVGVELCNFDRTPYAIMSSFSSIISLISLIFRAVAILSMCSLLIDFL